jgi:hypothetical protein
MPLAFRILHADGMKSPIARFVGRIFHCSEIRDLQGELSIGLDDPTDTGMLMRALIPTGITSSLLAGRSFMVRPSFSALKLAILSGWKRES